VNLQIRRFANAGYEVSFSQHNPAGFQCDIYGSLGDHFEAVAATPAEALDAVIALVTDGGMVTDAGPLAWADTTI
jgi:hypothetical protein